MRRGTRPRLACAPAASITSTWSSRRSSAACPSTAICSRRSAGTASPRSRGSAARRSGTSGAGELDRAPAGAEPVRGAGRPLPGRPAPPGARAASRAVVVERAAGSGAGSGDRERAGGVLLLAGLLRGLLLRPGRPEARDRARPRPGSLTKGVARHVDNTSGAAAARAPAAPAPRGLRDAEHHERRPHAGAGERRVPLRRPVSDPAGDHRVDRRRASRHATGSRRPSSSPSPTSSAAGSRRRAACSSSRAARRRSERVPFRRALHLEPKLLA